MINLISAIQVGAQVTLRYKITDAKGNILFNNIPGKPISYTHGTGEISSELENNMIGLLPGDSKSFLIKDEFDENTLYCVDVVIDAIDDMKEKMPAECGSGCNCESFE